MKLLLDENLSRRLVPLLEDLFPESAHVTTLDLMQVPDIEIWKFARDNGFMIVTADADFYELASANGPPPKVVWLRGCDYPTRTAAEVLRRHALRLTEFDADKERAVLILRP